MPLPSPPPAHPVLVASLEQLAELEATGRRVILRDGYAALALKAADLFSALYSLQCDGIRGADAIDNGPVEDLCSFLQRLDFEQERAA